MEKLFLIIFLSMVSTTVGNKKNFQLFNRSSKAKKTNKQAANTLDLHVK